MVNPLSIHNLMTCRRKVSQCFASTLEVQISPSQSQRRVQKRAERERADNIAAERVLSSVTELRRRRRRRKREGRKKEGRERERGHNRSHSGACVTLLLPSPS